MFAVWVCCLTLASCRIKRWQLWPGVYFTSFSWCVSFLPEQERSCHCGTFPGNIYIGLLKGTLCWAAFEDCRNYHWCRTLWSECWLKWVVWIISLQSSSIYVSSKPPWELLNSGMHLFPPSDREWMWIINISKVVNESCPPRCYWMTWWGQCISIG